MVRKIIANSCTRARDSKWDHFSRFSWQVRPKFRLKCLYWHFKTHWFPYSGRVETKFHKFSKVALRCVTSYIIVEVYWPLENYTAAPDFKIDVAKCFFTGKILLCLSRFPNLFNIDCLQSAFSLRVLRAFILTNAKKTVWMRRGRSETRFSLVFLLVRGVCPTLVSSQSVPILKSPPVLDYLYRPLQ